MTDSKVYCKDHPKEVADHVCMECCTLCCTKCTDFIIGKHKICRSSIIPLDSADPAKICEEFVPKAVEDLKKQCHRIEISDKLVDMLSWRHDTLVQNVEEAREKIRTSFACIREAIDLRERSLLAKLEEIVTQSKYSDFGTKLRTSTKMLCLNLSHLQKHQQKTHLKP